MWPSDLIVAIGKNTRASVGRAALHWFVGWAEHQKLSSGVLLGLEVLEYFVFAVDCLLYAWLIVVLGAKFIKQTWSVLNAH